MRILFISSSNIMAGNLSYVLTQEGHDVKLYIDDIDRKDNFDNLVTKTNDWKKELNWVGKNGLIIFDDIGYGEIQDKLRKKGYAVVGGSKNADKLETDREYAQKIFSQYGIKTYPTKDFKNIDEAIKFLRITPGPWVIKQNDCHSKGLNFVSNFADNRDTINLLFVYKKNLSKYINKITLQKKIIGVEIGVARYFNGVDWVGPIEINIEHKKFFTGNVGISTSEMGTVMWYDDNEKNKLFVETLHKLKPFLKKIDFRGDIDLNCIVNEHGAYPLEATPRFGSPAIYLQEELHISEWGEFLKAVASSTKYNLKWKKGYGIVVLVAAPPFPYDKKLKKISPKGIDINFSEYISEDIIAKHIHFEGVAMKRTQANKKYYISDEQGYVLYVTSVAESFIKAKKNVYKIISNIFIPKMMYRNDIGENFFKKDFKILKRLGYL